MCQLSIKLQILSVHIVLPIVGHCFVTFLLPFLLWLLKPTTDLLIDILSLCELYFLFIWFRFRRGRLSKAITAFTNKFIINTLVTVKKSSPPLTVGQLSYAQCLQKNVMDSLLSPVPCTFISINPIIGTPH